MPASGVSSGALSIHPSVVGGQGQPGAPALCRGGGDAGKATKVPGGADPGHGGGAGLVRAHPEAAAPGEVHRYAVEPGQRRGRRGSGGDGHQIAAHAARVLMLQAVPTQHAPEHGPQLLITFKRSVTLTKQSPLSWLGAAPV